jgi:hypothetical protein
MSLLEMFVEMLLRKYLGKYRDTPRPTKDEIADKIDQYLADTKGPAEGLIISIKKGEYRYYITRTLQEGRYQGKRDRRSRY